MRMLRWMCAHTRGDKDYEPGYTRQGGSDIRGRQDEGSSVEIVRACEEEVHGCTGKEV